MTLMFFKRFLASATKSKIESLINGSDVFVFMKGVPSAPQCGFSQAVIQMLKTHNITPNYCNVLEDEEIRGGIKEFSNWPTIPQVYLKGEFIGGCDVVLSMFKSGELEELLKDKKIIE
eukprot:NODE_478_length_7890_cov_0.158388.p6 type:complete len:118 gc:universal NODE_478_length_7890_cov_0.158388:5017-4664(-)